MTQDAPPLERIEAAEREVDRLARGPHRPGGRAFRMTVPVDARDSDVVLNDGLKAGREAVDALRCPAGCGCRWPDLEGQAAGATDADARDCACDGPCGWDTWDDFVADLLAHPEEAREIFAASRDMSKHPPFEPLGRSAGAGRFRGADEEAWATPGLPDLAVEVWRDAILRRRAPS